MLKDFHPKIFIEKKQIKQVDKCKTLGIIVDQHLSWKYNTINVCRKITAGICALRRIKPFVDKETLIISKRMLSGISRTGKLFVLRGGREQRD